MNQFKSSNIMAENDQIAEELKLSRQQKKISLEKAASDLKINIKYLKALEEGDFNKLPAGVYRKNFLKEYSLYLRLNHKEIIKKFNHRLAGQSASEDPFSKKKIKDFKLIIFPKIIKNLTIVLVVALCLIYLLFSLQNIILPPALEVSSPANNAIVKNNFIDIIGQSEPEAQVSINNEVIMTDASGVFTKRVSLSRGVNTIIIKAKKKYSRENTVIRQILVDLY